MFDDLEHYLRTIMAPERVELIIRLLQRLGDVVGEDNTSTVAQYSLGVPEDVDTADEIARFDDYLLDFLQASLSELGIVLDEEQLDSSRIPVIDNLVFSLQLVGGWDDSERILAIMTGADDLEMALAEVAEEITGGDSGEYALLIQSVSRAFYENLLALVQSNAESDIAQQSQPNLTLLRRVKTYFQTTTPADRYVAELIRSGSVVLGLEYPFYLKFYENTLFEQSPETLVQSLVDFAVCSDCADADVIMTAQNAIGNYTDSLEASVRYKTLMSSITQPLRAQFGNGQSETPHATA